MIIECRVCKEKHVHEEKSYYCKFCKKRIGWIGFYLYDHVSTLEKEIENGIEKLNNVHRCIDKI